jgi:ABC-type histidine transport system ATPase subunit
MTGADPRQIQRLRQRLGMVFQSFNLWAHMTVLQNVAEGPVHVLKRPKAEAEAEAMDILGKVGIAEKHDAYPAQLSGGQQQRVAIARALVSRPTVLFADEPTGNLDSSTGAEILELMRRSVDDLGQTIVMVTHEARAAAMADHVLFLADGRIVREVGHVDQHEILKIVDELDVG